MVCWKFSFCKTSPSGTQLTRFTVMVLIHVIPFVNDIVHSKTLQSLDNIPRWEIMPSVQWGVCLRMKAVAETATFRTKTQTQWSSIFETRIKVELGK